MSLKERWKNFKLWWKYPFLRPRTLTRDKYCSELFSYTLLHLLPEGWLKAFGIQLCEDLNRALMCCSKEMRSTFRIYDMKEKYGKLQISCNWYTPEINEVLHKYEKLSQRICIYCGHKAKWISKGYILPYCDNCMNKVKNEIKFVSIFKKGHKYRNNKKYNKRKNRNG